MDQQKISNLDSDLFTLWAGIEAAPARVSSKRERVVEYGEIPTDPLSVTVTDATITKTAANALMLHPSEKPIRSLKNSLLCRKINPAPTDVPVNSVKPSLRTKEALDYMASLLEANDVQAVVSEMPSHPVSPFWRTTKKVALIDLPANNAWQMMVWLASKEPQERWARFASQQLLSAEDPEKRDDALFRLTTLRQGGVELTWSFDEVKTPLLTLLAVEKRNLINPAHVKIAFSTAALTAALLKVPSLENHLQAYFLSWSATGRPGLNRTTEGNNWEKVWKRALFEGNLKAALLLALNNVSMKESVVHAWIESPRTNRARWHLLLITAFRSGILEVTNKHLSNAIERGHSSSTFLLASFGAKPEETSKDPEYEAGRKLYIAHLKGASPCPPERQERPCLFDTFSRLADGNSSAYCGNIANWPSSRDLLQKLLSSLETPFLQPNEQGWTALHESARLPSTGDFFSIFLNWAESQRGVSFAPRDNRGKTPYEVAVEEGNFWTARELRALQLLPIAPKRSDRP